MCGRFRAEDGDDLVGLPLDIERLEVVRHGDEIDFRREFHRRMAPIAVGERPELTGADEGLQLVLRLLHDLLSVQRPVAVLLDPGGGLDGIGLERRDDIDEIERGEVIEVDDVIVDRVRRHDHVADILRVQRHFELECILHRAHRRDGVNRRADAADALRYRPGVARIAAEEDQLDAAPHLPGGPRFCHLAAVDLAVHPQMAFDAGDGVDGDSRGHFQVSLDPGGCQRTRPAGWPGRMGKILTKKT